MCRKRKTIGGGEGHEYNGSWTAEKQLIYGTYSPTSVYCTRYADKILFKKNILEFHHELVRTVRTVGHEIFFYYWFSSIFFRTLLSCHTRICYAYEKRDVCFNRI